MPKPKASQGDSKALWEEVHAQIPDHEVRLGRATAAAYVSDPKMIAFMASRYKFVSKMLDRADTVLEIGCGDGFGAPIVAQSVQRLICTDISESTVSDCATRLSAFKNIEFKYHDFRHSLFKAQVDAVFAVDVLEHVYPDEEAIFLSHISKSLKPHGVALFGTPNVEAEKHASQNSRLGHVNLKSHEDLRTAFSARFHNVFIFSMNDEVVHTGYHPMAHYLWALCVGRKN
jgi:cyclopropane fatty-acyl-phospholipid synthase-like methyltransferase